MKLTTIMYLHEKVNQKALEAGNSVFWLNFYNFLDYIEQDSHKSWKVLEFEKCPGKKSWKSPGILHNICPMNFLFQLV